MADDGTAGQPGPVRQQGERRTPQISLRSLLIVFIAAFAGYLAHSHPGSVVTRELRIVDATGRTRVMMCASTSGDAQVWVLGAHDPSPAILLSVGNDDAAVIRIVGEDSQRRMALGYYGGDSSGVSFYRAGGTGLASLGSVGTGGAALRLFDGTGHNRLALAVENGWARFGMQDAAKHVQVNMEVAADGETVAWAKRDGTGPPAR